jgi:hypothetical protein
VAVVNTDVLGVEANEGEVEIGGNESEGEDKRDKVSSQDRPVSQNESI